MKPLTQKQKFIGTLLIVAVIALIAWNRASTRPDIRGHWISQTCEVFGSGTNQVAYIKRDMTLTGGEWNILVDFFSEPTCASKAMSVEVHGPYELGDASKEIQGATHGEFNIQTVKLTPYSPDTAQVFEQSTCGSGQWEVGQAKEVGATGCLNVVPKISDCPTEFDMVKLDGDQLFFGDRTYSLCERGAWPQSLGKDPLVKTK